MPSGGDEKAHCGGDEKAHSEVKGRSEKLGDVGKGDNDVDGEYQCHSHVQMYRSGGPPLEDGGAQVPDGECDGEKVASSLESECNDQLAS